MKKVIVGLSGGVDSSVSALLLKEQGYEVIGLFMKNWHDETVTISDECPWLDDSNDAMLIAEKLGIPFQTVDLSKEYHSRIIDYMFNEYENGRTPNPGILSWDGININKVQLKDIPKQANVSIGDTIVTDRSDPGGQKQRVMIVMALSCNPRLLIAENHISLKVYQNQSF